MSNLDEEKNEIESSLFGNEPQYFSLETEDDLDVDYLDSITNTALWSTDWTVESIISAQKRSSFNINPDFQRRDAWDITKKSRFIESLIFGLPVPQIVLAEDKEHRGKYIVVDGKQRLITLFSFFSENPNNSFRLGGLKSNKTNNLSRSELEQIYPELYENLLNQSIRSIIIKNWSTENLLFTIFYRLNSGSLPLSPQELRKALKPGDFLKRIDYYCNESNGLIQLFGKNIPDPRMRDMDLILRFFVMTKFIDKYTGNYKQAIDQLCDYYNKNWSSLENEVSQHLKNFEIFIITAIEIFGIDEVFRRKSQNKTERRINRALFDVIAFYFLQFDPSVLLNHKTEVKNVTEALCTRDQKFIKAISSNTNNLKEISTRYVLYGEALKNFLNDLTIPQNLITHYNKN